MKFLLENYRADIQWNCRMCGNIGNNVVATTHSHIQKHAKHEIIQCGNCGSLYYAGENPVIGYENEAMNHNYWLHYSQIGAGFTAMLEPLFYLGERAKGSLLDVGCGFGYVVDFYNKIGYGDAVGLETAAYGKIGAKVLGAPIINSYYSGCQEIHGKKFDIIFSCEVLEHVPNPRSFIDEISEGLSDEGVLVLTTPSSNVIHSNSNKAEVVGSLSPDYHYFLSSPMALETLLKKCGYKDVRVDDSGSRLYAWASKKSLPFLQKQMPWHDYFKYLEILSENIDPNVKSGALQRLFKDSWNTGHVAVASSTYTKLEKLANKHYGLSFEYPDIVRYNSRKSIISEIDKHPAWYPSVLYFGGIYVGAIENKTSQKVRMIDASLGIIENEVKCLDPRLVQESEHLLPSIKKSLLAAYNEASNINLQKKQINISICTLYKQDKKYNKFILDLLQAGFSKDNIFGLSNQDSTYDCFSAIRKFLKNSTSDFTVICHDDIGLENLNKKSLIDQISSALVKNPRAAVFGIAGKDSRIIRGQGHFIGPKGEEKWGIDSSRAILSLDECFLVVRNGLGIMVGEGLEGYHFYGTDLCLQARKLGYSSHVIDFPIRHESTGTLNDDFFKAKEAFEKYLKKNGDKVFIPTTCTLLYSGNNIFLNAFSDAISLIMIQQSNHKDFPDANKAIFENCSNEYPSVLLKIFLVKLRLFFLFQKFSYKKILSRIFSDLKWWRKNWRSRLLCSFK